VILGEEEESGSGDWRFAGRKEKTREIAWEGERSRLSVQKSGTLARNGTAAAEGKRNPFRRLCHRGGGDRRPKLGRGERRRELLDRWANWGVIRGGRAV